MTDPLANVIKAAVSETWTFIYQDQADYVAKEVRKYLAEQILTNEFYWKVRGDDSGQMLTVAMVLQTVSELIGGNDESQTSHNED